jgi:hypothetical protein
VPTFIKIGGKGINIGIYYFKLKTSQHLSTAILAN